MKKYIEVKKAIKALTGWETDPTDEEIKHTLDNIPAADVVEVIRCKKCKHYIAKSPAPADPLEPLGDCCIHGCDIWPDDFCSYGEKKKA